MSRTTLWTRLSQLAAPSRRRSASKFARRPACGGLEMLEDRKLMTVTDLADAALLVGHVQPYTHLYINFDGGTAPTDFSGNNFRTIRAFETEAGDGALNRDRDIQDILFQVAEVYSPFDVQVERIYGAGAYSTDSGNTTVFVGADNTNSSLSAAPGTPLYTKYLASFTPAAFSDGQKINHQINSDPYDVAFVDPVAGTSNNVSNLNASLSTETQSGDPTRANIFDIRRSIAHEAGHTFGLAHVRTDGQVDPVPVFNNSGSVNDVQSYDSQNVFFANQRLTLSTVNNSPTGNVFNLKLPAYHDAAANQDVTLVTENSYQTLGRILGYRSQNEGSSLVADSATIDPIARQSVLDLSNQSLHYGSIGREGDYQAFRFTPTGSGLNYDRISVQATYGNLSPQVLVYDAGGKNLISVVKPSGGVATLTNLKAGSTYTIVIGSVGGSTTGGYTASITHVTLASQTAYVNRPESQYSAIAASHSGLVQAVNSVGLHAVASIQPATSGFAHAVNSVGLNAVASLQPDTSGTSLDLDRVARLSFLTQVQLIGDAPEPVDPIVPPATDQGITDTTVVTDPAVTDLTATPTDAVIASDLTVVVDTTQAVTTVAIADPSTPVIDEPPVDTTAGPGLVAMATDAALEILAPPVVDALALAQVIDGTSLLDPNATSVPSGV